MFRQLRILGKILRRNLFLAALVVLFLVHLFFRFYGLESYHQFGWDQVDNAWAAKNIIVEHKLPLVGMVAKQNSGFYIGPLYYYYISLFYLITNLDPFASYLIAGVSSIITFFVLYYFIKKLTSKSVALAALFIHTFSLFIILSDRTQWPVDFIAPISIMIFYFLLKVLEGSEKHILALAVALGISWQLNFTAIFFFLCTIFALPFFPRTRKSLAYALFSIPIVFLFFIPNILFDLFNKQTSSKHLNAYMKEYYHGFHATRVLQLAKDAFIEFASILNFAFLKEMRYIFVPAFLFLYLRKQTSKGAYIFCYLVVLWFLIPWLVFSVYKGEISNYYFSMTRPITIMILGYFVVWVYTKKNIFAKVSVIFLMALYTLINSYAFFTPVYRPLAYHRERVLQRIQNGEKIEFSQFDPEAFIYYVYTQNGQGNSRKK